MAFGLQTRNPRSASAIPIARSDDRDRSEVAGLISAGVMTFLLSGDLRLATRATRLLLSDGRPPPSDRADAHPSRHRVWHRRR
jgi:hypothetical protein